MSKLSNQFLTILLFPLVICSCGRSLPALDSDGDGWRRGEDCNDSNSAVHPLARELCNNVDDDCDGIIDNETDGAGDHCSTGQFGVCSPGRTICLDGSLLCQSETDAGVELCNGLDDDCDGFVDESFPESDSACETGLAGVCSVGTRICRNSELLCQRDSDPAQEHCNGMDDDCDGLIDNNLVDVGAECQTDLLGECSSGVLACEDGRLVCSQLIEGGQELCNGLDDDCDGLVDEENPEGDGECLTGLFGVCAGGFLQCIESELRCTPLETPADEICNNLDDDCDGSVDDAPGGIGIPRETDGLGQCATGSTQCISGAIFCVPDSSPAPEACNGLDDDCDGVTDNDPVDSNLSCSTGEPGLCSEGATACNDGSLICEPVNTPGVESCNGLDDNCDGQIDEVDSSLGLECATGLGGACESGHTDCVAGELACIADLRLEPEYCNGLDDNCDGLVDSSCPVEVWSIEYDMGTGHSAPVLADLDGDGELEVVFSTSTHSVLDQDTLYVLNADGTNLDPWPRQMEGLLTAPAIVDLDGNGELEIVYSSWVAGEQEIPIGGIVSAIEVDGTTLPGWPVQKETGYSSPAIGDVDASGSLDVFIGSLDGIVGWNNLGEILPGWPQHFLPSDYCHSTPAIGDLDGDGKNDIVASCSHSPISAFKFDGTAVVGWPVSARGIVMYSPVLGDLDNDGTLEVIVVASDSYSSSSHKLYVYNSNGTIREGFPVSLGTTQSTLEYPCIALGHLDDDDYLDIVVGDYAISRNGQHLSGWPIGYRRACAILVDIDNDGRSEVIQPRSQYIVAIDGDGSVLPGWPIWAPGPVPQTPESNVSYLAAGDLDNDGRLDIIAVENDGRYLSSKTIIRYELGQGSYNPNGLEWPMFQHDPGHTGRYASP